MNEDLDRIWKRKVISIVRGLPVNYMLDLAQALCAGGIDLMEITSVRLNLKHGRTRLPPSKR